MNNNQTYNINKIIMYRSCDGTFKYIYNKNNEYKL